MSFTLTFVNKGEIDVRAITTFGVNVKESDSAIGYFGTGLKYAIAILLRKGCGITIYSGIEAYHFNLEAADIRGKKFQVITMNDQPLGFTTEVGKNWELWQAFRELYCNTMDEDGYMTTDLESPRYDRTLVVVHGHPLKEVYEQRHEIILNTQPLLELAGAEIHPGESRFVYNKGIRVYELDEPTCYTYNITKNVTLTEDRTIAFEFEALRGITSSICRMSESDPEAERILKTILTAGKGYTEHRFDLTMQISVDPFILEMADQLRLSPGVNPSVHPLLLSHAKAQPPKPVDLSSIQEQQLDRAIKFCRRIGYAVDRYPIVVSDSLQGSLHGLAENETIYMSPDVFGMGTKYVAATLLEEYLHLHTGYGDMSRDLQSYLFNAIMSLGEQVIGEPL